MDHAAYPEPEVLREKAAEILASRDYELESHQADDGWMFSLLAEILDWMLTPFRWLSSMMEGLPAIVRWTIMAGLFALLVVLIGHIVYSIIRSIRRPARISGAPTDRASALDPDGLERLSREAAGRQDFVTAIRFLFRASVIRLERIEKKSIRPGTTNRGLLWRYRNRPELGGALRLFVDMIDRKWYGDEDCTEGDYVMCQQAHHNLCRLIEEPVHALRA